MIVFPVVLCVTGLAFLVAGWQGFRIEADPAAAALLDPAELRHRRLLARAGGYACLVAGCTLLLTAALVTYKVLALS